MKKFSSEIGHNYETYTFGYAHYCAIEEHDKLSAIYEQGYLPYSGSPDAKGVFYMARSARVPLASFVPTSENRRVLKKFQDAFQREVIPFKSFDRHDKDFLKFCTDYFEKRHGPAVMPLARLKAILNSGLITEVIVYTGPHGKAAYVLEVSDAEMGHFWYSFYDLELVHRSLGMWLMLDNALRAKENGKKYFYVGTLYGEKALYKTSFADIEYWNGAKWIADVSTVKQLGRTDRERIIGITDLWKKERKTF